MSLHRFFVRGAVPATEEAFELPLSAADIHHAVHVLRLRVGEHIALAAPDMGAVFEIALTNVADEGVQGVVVGKVPQVREPHVTLIQGLTKGSKIESVIEKSVEVGVEAVWPVGFERSLARYDAERATHKGERWRRVAESAAKQSGRSFVPQVADPAGSEGLIGRLETFDIVLVPWEEADNAPGVGEALREAGASADSVVAVVVGPEGGLTQTEIAAFEGAGAVTVTLGDTILRTETAGILSVALCVYELGGLGGRSRG